jgi:hypothetical protein
MMLHKQLASVDSTGRLTSLVIHQLKPLLLFPHTLIHAPHIKHPTRRINH